MENNNLSQEFMTNLTQRVYSLLKQVPPGRITTYKELAHASHTKAYRAIGQMMRHNPNAPQVPCHRCVASDGTIGGFMGKTSGVEIKKKIALLKKEGVNIENNRIVDFEKIKFEFS